MTELKSAYKKMSKTPRMIQLVLTNESRQLLEKTLQPFKFSNKQAQSEQYCHHITIAYKPTLEQFAYIQNQLQENEKVVVKVIERAWSDSLQIEAVRVELPINIPWLKYPHITVSMEGNKPALSNEMLTSSDKQSEQVSELTLETTLKYYK